MSGKQTNASIATFVHMGSYADKVRGILSRHERIHPEDSYGLDRYWKDLSDALLEDVNAYISFLINDCTDTELILLSEVDDELIIATQSEHLVHALKTAQERFPDATREYRLDANLAHTISSCINDKDKARKLLAWKPVKTD